MRNVISAFHGFLLIAATSSNKNLPQRRIKDISQQMNCSHLNIHVTSSDESPCASPPSPLDPDPAPASVDLPLRQSREGALTGLNRREKPLGEKLRQGEERRSGMEANAWKPKKALWEIGLKKR